MMITEIARYWEGHLQKLPSAIIEGITVPDADKKFLTSVGLPERFPPDQYEAMTAIGLNFTPHSVSKITVSDTNYLEIGTLSFPLAGITDKICIAENSGNIMRLGIEFRDDVISEYVNTNIELFLKCLIVYSTHYPQFQKLQKEQDSLLNDHDKLNIRIKHSDRIFEEKSRLVETVKIQIKNIDNKAINDTKDADYFWNMTLLDWDI